MSKTQIIVLSDIHIGDDSPTVWYQSSVHNPYLAAITAWVVDNADSIREVVLLGDVVDFWTYPADRRPPAFGDIVAAQPAIFGAAGFFGQMLDALDGAVTLVPGNHDMTVTAADAASVVSAGGHALRYADSVYYPLGPGDQRLALAHGNAYTMFNAPDPQSPWAPTPVGHFITRMIASQWARDLKPGQTVAGLSGQGSPNGLDVGAIIEGAINSGSFGITKLLLDSVAAQTGTASTQTFLMPDGSVAALDTAVYPAFDDLFTRWANASGGGAQGYTIAAKSALADAKAYFMGWFAQRQAFQSGAQAIVLGHTHAPISGIDTTLITYANSGFECPSTPDMPAQCVSFAVIDTTNFTTQIMQAGPGGAIGPLAAPTTPIVPVGSDFSSYVVVNNTGADDMTLVASDAPHGYWVNPPPQAIPAGGSVYIWAQDYVGPVGSEGSFSYTSPSRGQQDFAFACPTLSSNSCSGGQNFRTKSGSNAWGAWGDVAGSGHPFYVEFQA